MPRLNPEARARMVAAAADIIRHRGVTAMSVRDLAAHAGAPLGSTYHYFPGGKQQVVTEAVAYAGDVVGELLRAQLEAGPVDGLRGFLALWRRVVVDADYSAGCPVLAVAVEDPDRASPALAATADVFAAWQSLLSAALEDHRVDPVQSRALACTVVAAVEGAVVMCRAARSTRPLEQVAAVVVRLVESTVAGVAPRT